MTKKSVFVIASLLLCIVFAAVHYAVPAYGSDESLLTASVTVTPPVSESYGTRVSASSWVFLRRLTLGEPDSGGAWMLRRGRIGGGIGIELEDMVADCSKVSIWAAKRGRRAPSFKVYVSADGSHWTYIGSGKCTSTGYTRYDFSGDFGEVKYVGVKRDNKRFAVILLDAVMAERR